MREILDQQVQQLEKTKESEKKKYRDMAITISQDVETYQEELKRKKHEQVERYRKHQKEVVGQIDQRSKLLQFIGGFVVFSTE